MDLKQKLLVIEASSHYQVLEPLYDLFNSKFQLTFYFVKPIKNSFKLLNRNVVKGTLLLARFKGLLIFLNAIRLGRKYDYIYISTGPEGDHFTDFLNILFFYFLCQIYGDKIILTIRNLAPYIEPESSIFSWVRTNAIKKINNITFETYSMRSAFKSSGIPYKANLGVIYFRCANVKYNLRRLTHTRNELKPVKIGLLGAVDAQRRDYDLLFNSLSGLSPDILDKLEIVILGRCLGVKADLIISGLKRFVRVTKIENVLSEKEFNINGNACDVLLAPLRDDRGYGTFKGTGAIADAIYLNRTLILPNTVDIRKEFADFCQYYKTPTQLANLFKRVCEQGLPLNPEVFMKYSPASVFARLSEDLKLFSIK